MTCFDEVQAAPNQRDAVLVLAKHIDEILSKLGGRGGPADDGWGAWEVPESSAPAQPQPSSASAIEAVKAQLATAVGEDADALRAKLRLLEDENRTVENVVPEGRRELVTVTDNEVIINLPAPSPERAHARRQWAQDKQLHTFFAPFKNDPEGIVRHYVKAGPLWLYHSDRDAVMQMPYEWRRDLVEDIAVDSPATAQEVGRDILKATTEQQRDFVFEQASA